MGLLLIKAQLLDNPTDGVVVGGEAEADDLGVEPLELGHGSARAECIVQVGVLMIGLMGEEHRPRQPHLSSFAS